MEPYSGFTTMCRTCLFYLLISCVSGIYIRAPRNSESYAQYPKWNACVNASFSFDFKTRQPTGLLMYMDGGEFDFFELRLDRGVAKLRLNIVHGNDGSVHFQVGRNLNDNNWHRVTIKRNRMETILSVDQESAKNLSYGSDFNFGDLYNNSDVYFGGIPKWYGQNLNMLALPSVWLEKRLAVEIRNVIYGNCSCEPVRGSIVKGMSLHSHYTEACEQNNPCSDCLCISADSGPKCQCDENKNCAKGTKATFYHLPMDKLEGRTSVNPSGLDANIDGSEGYPQTVRGAKGNAIRIYGRRQWLQVSGPGHRYECFGDLDLCSQGYTLGLWVNFNNVGDTKGVYMSNGGHSSNSHGVAMMYKTGEIEFVFRKRDGQYWSVKYDNVFEDRWYHVLVTWRQDKGLALYVNGDIVDETFRPKQRVALTKNPRFNDFLIGRSNDRTGLNMLGRVIVDELKFWSEFKDEYQVKELGPMYRYYFDMNEISGRELVVTNAATEVYGNVQAVPGKIGNALRFNKDGGHVDLGGFKDTCLGDPGLCEHGFLIAFWLKLDELRSYSYYFSSNGINIYSKGSTMYATVQTGYKVWKDNFPGLEKGRWHFIEISWSESKGISMYLDLLRASMQAGHSVETATNSSDPNFYIGKAHSAKSQEYPYGLIDDVEILYGERATLLFLDLIQRGKPTKNYFDFESKIGDRLYHPTMFIDTYGSPKIVRGKIGNAIKLNGQKQVVDFGEQQSKCLGNLDYCHHGALMAMWFNPTTFNNNMYFASSGKNGITISNTGNTLMVTASTTTHTWNVSTDVLTPNYWYFLEVSWDPETGLKLFINDNIVAESNTPQKRKITTFSGFIQSSVENKFYLGRGNLNMNSNNFGKATYDEMEYWYAPREYLIAFDYIQRGKPRGFMLDMEKKNGYKIVHSTLPLQVFGNPQLVQGVIGNALYLNGNNQYLDIGDHSDECLGDLEKCKNGITISAWLNFKDFLENMYILSTGKDGIRTYYKNGNIYSVVHQDGKEWEIAVPKLDTNAWHFMEWSWHPDFGLSLYINNTLIATSTYKNVAPQSKATGTRVYVGRQNRGDSRERTRTAKMTVDEMEVWYGRRKELVAFDYILRDNIEHETISMETASRGKVYHPRINITLANGARLSSAGLIGNALSLGGVGQYVDLGNHGDQCFGNLNKCKNGLTISLWLKARQLVDGTYFLSSPSYTLSYKDGQLIARFFANGKMWEVSSPNMKADRWQQVMMSWTPKDGIGLFLDGKKQGSTNTWTQFQADDPNTGSVYIGRSKDNSRNTVNALVDELQYFYAPRDQAIVSGQLQGYINHQALPLDRVIRRQNGTYSIQLPTRKIILHGGVTRAPGQHSQALRIDGKSQYLDFGDDLICNGNLQNCESRGFTVQFSVKPERLQENMYFLDSFPLSVYYRDGKLFATVRTKTESWTVSSPEFIAGEWQLVEITWQPQRGLTMLINGAESAHQTFGTPQALIKEWNRKTYFGRSLSEPVRERYADATIERLDVWNVQKEHLQAQGLIPPDGNVTSEIRTGGIFGDRSLGVVTIKPGVEIINDINQPVIVNPVVETVNRNSGGRVFVNQINKDITVIEPTGDLHTKREKTRITVGGSGGQLDIELIDNLTGRVLMKGETTPRPVATTQSSVSRNIIHTDDRYIIHKRYNTNIIRFLGNAYVHYDFNRFGANYPRMLERVSNETFHFQFVTQKENGLIWLDNRKNQVMFLAIKDGYLTFYLDEGPGITPHTVQLRTRKITDLNDNRWHTFAIQRLGKHWKFYVDEEYVGQLHTRNEIQLVSGSDVYLGGSPDNLQLTDRYIENSFDGAVTEVIYTKYASNTRVTIVSLLAHIETLGSRHGDIIIYKPGHYDTTQRPPVITTPRLTRVVILNSLSMQEYGVHMHATGSIDLRSGGELTFKFRTRQHHGLLFVLSRQRTTLGRFIAMEVVDGQLYFVYDFGSITKRELISDDFVSNGRFHTVSIRVISGRVVITLNNVRKNIAISSQDLRSMYFAGGILFGGPQENTQLSWHIMSRNGFVGCITEFTVHMATTDMGLIRVTNTPGISDRCTAVGNACTRSNVCGSGTCRYHSHTSYHCYCAGTGLGGDNCDRWPVTAAFDRGTYVLYAHSHQQTHTNDFSVRFKTDRDGVLFQTHSTRGHDDFIRAVLENGRIKLTFRINGQEQVYYTGYSLTDDQWHTFNLRRRANHLEMWIDNLQHQKETLRGENFYIHFDQVYYGSLATLYPSLSIPNFHGYMHNVYVERTDVFENLKHHIGGHWPIYLITFDEFNNHHFHVVTLPPTTTVRTTPKPLPTKIRLFSTVSITEYGTHLHITGHLDMRRGGEISFRFKTLQQQGYLFIIHRSRDVNSVSTFMSFEIFDGKLYFVYDFGGGTHRELVSNNFVSSGQWQNVRLVMLGNSLQIYLNNVPKRISLTNTNSMYFAGGIMIGGPRERNAFSWYTINRKGYVGCIGDFVLQSITTDMRPFPVPNVPGISRDCVTETRHCDNTALCRTGVCQYYGYNSYRCLCAGTGFAGKNCDTWPVTGVFEDNHYVVYDYNTYKTTHSNDFSVRFRTSQENAVLFQTHSTRGHNDFIRAVLENGRIKVTVRVNGKDQEYYVGSNLNDNHWHTFNLKRHGGNLEMWIDDLQRQLETINGKNFYIHYDKVYYGSLADLYPDLVIPTFHGSMHNVYIDQHDIFEELKENKGGHWPIFILTEIDYLNHPFRPVTFINRKVYADLEPLYLGQRMHLTFKFKTTEENGLILFNRGQGKQFIAIELVNGYIHFKLNNGRRTSNNKISTKKLNDNRWHLFQLREQVRGEQRQFVVSVDDVSGPIINVGADRLAFTGRLFIGGISDSEYLDTHVRQVLSSNNGFIGCLSDVELNGQAPDLVKYASHSNQIVSGCRDILGVCPVGACLHGGICTPGLNDFTCNCQLTAFWGLRCQDYPNGTYFGEATDKSYGVITYTFDNVLSSGKDEIVLGFMTYYENGILYRMESSLGNEFVEIKLENGYVVAHYNTGSGLVKLKIDSNIYNDGKYHVLKFIRTGDRAELIVDDLQTFQQHESTHSVFDQIYRVYIGGQTDTTGSTILNRFNGIIGGVYWNNYRFIDMAHHNDLRIKIIGDHATLLHKHEYILHPPIIPTPRPRVPLPPTGNGPFIVPHEIGGSGIVGPGASGVGPGEDLVVVGKPGGVGGGYGSPGFANPPKTIPLTGGPVPVAPPAAGPRAGALVGTLLGTMAFLASLMWAFWKCKPGMITCPGGGGGGGVPPATISAPTQSNLGVVQAMTGGSGGAGSGSSAAGGGATKIQVVNGSATGGGVGGAGGAGSGGYTSYYSSSTTTATGGGGGAGGGGTIVGGGGDMFDSATLRATGTFSNKGTAIGTPKATRAFLGSTSSTGGGAGGGKSTYMYSSETTTYKTGGGEGGSGGAGFNMGYGESTTADYDMATPSANYQSNTLSSSMGSGLGGGTMTKTGYNTMSSSYNYQVQNVRTMMSNQAGNQMVQYSATSSGAVTPGAAGDEVRVDCCLMATDGRSVVTGSSLGPPQVWDMQTGELLRIMKGDTVGSTNLHLACNDRLLVGAVHADLEVNEFSTRKGVTNKKLQIWDFTTGKPLEMGTEETCSALCVMSDPDKVVFARSEKYGNATHVIVWDLLGNQPLKEMKYDAPIGNNDYVNFLKLSHNDRYCVLGFTNTFDNHAEFVIFDTNLTNYNITDPCLLRLDANPECTVILPRDEAVTGLRNGDLVVWSLRTGQPSRQLLSGSGVHAHNKEVKAVVLSDDKRYLVSASADGTLKVWDMQTERQINTLSGHTDEVWCVAISPDNEIVVSGGRDASIRLWRMKNGSEICAFSTGVDVFYVTMSHDKGTIVALGDKFGARKLIMLQVVRTKIRRQVSS